jgi:hypothetical protein
VRLVGSAVLATVQGEDLGLDRFGLVRLDAASDRSFDWLRSLFERQIPKFILDRVDRALSGIVRGVDEGLKSILRIDPMRLIGRKALDGIRRRNVNLIKTVSQREINRLETIVRANADLHVRDLVALIQERINVDESRAELWARDQTLKANAEVTKERHFELGITEYIWTTSGDERVRGDPSGAWPVPKSGGGDHFSLEGRIFKYSEPPIVDTRTGRRANPGEDYQCRCTAYPIVTGGELLDSRRRD